MKLPNWVMGLPEKEALVKECNLIIIMSVHQSSQRCSGPMWSNPSNSASVNDIFSLKKEIVGTPSPFTARIEYVLTFH